MADTNANVNTRTATTNTTKKQQRCSLEICRRKLCMVDLECLCKKRFCAVHRLPEDHACCFNFKERDREILEKSFVVKESNVNLHGSNFSNE